MTFNEMVMKFVDVGKMFAVKLIIAKLKQN
jgi:hypothetical protein